ncbi:Protein CBG03229 [Caenorhabditis briggsae]|uniref:Protein CBG03229 n=1 Tax=Caenorhabditis briggsae TaxID=6238 RepID=A8WSH8_CAEBR|nr:Protein CBG03229 [Caenorhabditis briggsae]CAP23437.1 Protein CBG03229 [Caenorhabditis briggsae]
MPRTTHKEVRPFHGMGSNDTSSQERRVGEDDVPYAVKEMATLEDTSNVDFEMELEDMDKDEDTDEDDGGQTEIFPPDTKFIRKSDLFVIDPSSFARDIRRVYLHSNYENIENLRNGSDKTHHLRLTLALTALVSDSMKPKARLVLIALGFLTNKMYSNTQAPTLFDIQLSAAAAWYLAEANKEYITMKTHAMHYLTPNRSSRPAPYRLPLTTRTSPSTSSSSRLFVDENQRKHARGTDYTRGNLYTATVNQKWSPIGFAATQLYDMETGSAFDRETCERHRLHGVAQFGKQMSRRRERLLEKFSLGMATQTALVDNADELLVCYGSSQKANKYVPVNPSIFTKMSGKITNQYVIKSAHTQTTSSRVLVKRTAKTEKPKNRVRARYNAKFGKSQSEQAAIWLHDELMKGEASELKSHPLNFNSSNVSGEDAPNFSGTPNYDGSGDDVDDSIDIEGC